MCGRYTNETEFSQIRLLFHAEDATFRAWTPKYNISPSAKGGFEQLMVVADRAGSRQLRLGRFWLIPSFWSKPLSLLPTTFNARSEELDQKKLWREPYAHSRCLVPATGWREFVGAPAGPSARKPVRKQPFHFRPRVLALPDEGLPEERLAHGPSSQAAPFAFAGLWSTWTSAEGEVADSFAILTTTPSAAAQKVHDRMPLVLPAELYDAWLTADAQRAEVLAQARGYTSALELEIFPSDPVANSVHYEGPAASNRVEPGASSPAQLSLLDRLPKAGPQR